MKFSKSRYILSIAVSILVCSVTYADTCYDPNYDSYYNCAGDEYVAPVNAGALFGAIIYNNNNDYDYDNHGHYHNGYGNGYDHHGDYNNGYHGGYHNGYHGGHHGHGGR